MIALISFGGRMDGGMKVGMLLYEVMALVIVIYLLQHRIDRLFKKEA
jgi:hypothetical protein